MTAKKVFEELTRRYGFPADLFKGWELVEHEEDVFITTEAAARFDRIRPVRKGIRLARIFAHGIKPTTNAMQVFGSLATRNKVELTREQVQAFIHGETISLDSRVEPGFVIVIGDGFAVGVGLYKEGKLKSQVPLSRRTAEQG